MTSSSTSPHVVVISGATRGLGLVTARHWAAAGSGIALCSRNDNEAVATAAQLHDDFGVAALGMGVDVSKARDVARFASAVNASLGGADLLVNNAAVLGPVGPLAVANLDEWSEAIDVNLKGSANLIAAFLPLLARSKRGRVINLSGGGVGGPHQMERTSAYVVSKIAVVGLTEALAPELAESGVTINALAPGALHTEFLGGVIAAGAERAGQALFDDAATRDGDVGAQAAPYLRLLDFIAHGEQGWLTGRMLSAKWDQPEQLEGQRPLPDGRFRLRRIDDDLFAEVSA